MSLPQRRPRTTAAWLHLHYGLSLFKSLFLSVSSDPSFLDYIAGRKVVWITIKSGNECIT
ncbi:hypothetical protein Hanom_Chr14g01300291 [Helianthus anomalus]